MAEKRRDNKNRVLKTGESQRKDGRYMYKYIDIDGKPKYEYSWKLVPTDKSPAGKKDELCLRDKIKEVEKRLENGIQLEGKKISVIELVDKSMENRKLREGTRRTYDSCILHIRQSPFGARKIDKIKTIDAKEFLRSLQDEKQLSFSSASNIGSILRNAFQEAEDDDLIGKNPFRFAFGKVLVKNGTRRRALTEEQKQALLEFASKETISKRYYDMIVILLETGLRISELAGLRIKDVDMKKKVVHVRHQLSRHKGLAETKSAAGVRSIPMSKAAYRSFVNVLRKRDEDKVVCLTGKEEQFLFVSRNGQPIRADGWDSVFERLSVRWAKADKRAVHVTPHICRHTYCTTLVQAGVNVKVVQYLMGHSSSRITLDVYSDVRSGDAAKELKKIGLA